MSVNDLYANLMVQHTDLVDKYNNLVKSAQTVAEENKKLKAEIEELKKPKKPKKT